MTSLSSITAVSPKVVAPGNVLVLDNTVFGPALVECLKRNGWNPMLATGLAGTADDGFYFFHGETDRHLVKFEDMPQVVLFHGSSLRAEGVRRGRTHKIMTRRVISKLFLRVRCVRLDGTRSNLGIYVYPPSQAVAVAREGKETYLYTKRELKTTSILSDILIYVQSSRPEADHVKRIEEELVEKEGKIADNQKLLEQTLGRAEKERLCQEIVLMVDKGELADSREFDQKWGKVPMGNAKRAYVNLFTDMRHIKGIRSSLVDAKQGYEDALKRWGPRTTQD